MKIKHLLPVLCALAVFSSVNLMAQSDPNNSSTPPPAAPAVHVGTDNPYKIGTAEDPVIAIEYLAFLKTKAGPNQTTTTPFYDKSFMIEQSWDRFGPHVTSNPNACISFTINSPDHCSFDLLTGHENDIVDGVQSEQIQKEFNEWRQNPKVSDLCDYMNDVISKDLDAANAIKNKYPNAMAVTVSLPPILICAPSGGISPCIPGLRGTPFDLADDYLRHIDNQNVGFDFFINDLGIYLIVDPNQWIHSSTIVDEADRPILQMQSGSVIQVNENSRYQRPFTLQLLDYCSTEADWPN